MLRECLALRQKRQPDLWTTFNTQWQHGGALLGLGRYADAEPLLLAGLSGMKERERAMPAVRRIPADPSRGQADRAIHGDQPAGRAGTVAG